MTGEVRYCEKCSYFFLKFSLIGYATIFWSSMGGLRFDASRALVGELSQFNMWDRPISHTELSALALCSTRMLGNVVPWTSREVEVFGGVTKQPAEHCEHSTSARQ